MALAPDNITAIRRQLGLRLRRLRQEAGKSESEVQSARIVSRSKLWRIESGRSSVRMSDVRTLCWLYGADQRTTDDLAALAFGTMEPGWRDEFGDTITDRFRLYVGLEESATQILRYEAEHVFGLFQTADYAKALFATHPGADDQQRAAFLKVRLGRQVVLERIPPPRLRVVLNAAVLARPVGGERVMAEQVAHLRELGRRPNIEIRVLPWAAGAHAAMAGAFTVFEFDDPDDPPVAYYDTFTEARYLEKPRELARYRSIFKSIMRQSVPLEEYS